MHTAYGETAVLDRETQWEPDRAMAHAHYLAGRRAQAAEAFLRQPNPPRGPVEVALMAEGLADSGDERALPHIAGLGAAFPAEADAVLGRLRFRQKRYEESAAALERSFLAYRTDPWPAPSIMAGAFSLAAALALEEPGTAPRLFAALAVPFPVYALEGERLMARLRIARTLPMEAGHCGEAVEPLASPVAWNLEFLLFRRNCYEAMGDPRAGRARADLEEFLRNEQRERQEPGGE